MTAIGELRVREYQKSGIPALFGLGQLWSILAYMACWVIIAALSVALMVVMMDKIVYVLCGFLIFGSWTQLVWYGGWGYHRWKLEHWKSGMVSAQIRLSTIYSRRRS